MELQSLNCNRCGAPLQVPTTANFVTCSHCSAQLGVERTETTVSTRQLDQLASNQDEMLEKLDRLERQTRVSQIDRAWETQRESFMISDKHGVRRMPSNGGAIVSIVFVVVFGIFWMGMASRISPPMSLFGLIFIGFGVFSGIRVFKKAEDLRRAERRYRQQRNEAMRND